ncbi:MAG: ketopantoate reductase family protein, partial [Rudaea sp.]
MKILIIGAGVVGSIYAARLHWAGEQVSLLARGQRLAELRENAVVLEDEGTGQRTTTPVPLIDHLDPDDEYDLVMVIMRKDQVPWVLPMVAESRCTPNVLFVGNNVAGPEEYTRALGPERVLLGFAGSGGRREGNQVRFVGGMGG